MPRKHILFLKYIVNIWQDDENKSIPVGDKKLDDSFVIERITALLSDHMKNTVPKQTGLIWLWKLLYILFCVYYLIGLWEYYIKIRIIYIILFGSRVRKLTMECCKLTLQSNYIRIIRNFVSIPWSRTRIWTEGLK